jgi:hypothetical protein
MGLFLPWAGSYTSGALVSRSLWLWLGILDSLQGLGFGMILLQTLTRMHICFTLLASQVLGSIATICARAFAPNNIGPGPISPDVTDGASSVANAWFWISLFFQLLIWYVLYSPTSRFMSTNTSQQCRFSTVLPERAAHKTIKGFSAVPPSAYTTQINKGTPHMTPLVHCPNRSS